MTSERSTDWQGIYAQYLYQLKQNLILEADLRKIDDMIFSKSLEQVHSGLSLLFALNPVYLCRYVTMEDDRIVLINPSLWQNDLWMERAVVQEVQSCREFGTLLEAGAFDAMHFHGFDVPLRELTESEKAFCLNRVLEMKLLTGGAFTMGGVEHDNHARPYELPRHTVILPDELWVGRFQVTQLLWSHVMGECLDNNASIHRPVETVNWFDCVAFCNRMSEMEGRDPVYHGLNGYEIGQPCTTLTGMDLGESITANHQTSGYRLLTEAEWEYAARGGTSTIYSGSDDPQHVGWGKLDKVTGVCPVGQKQANGFGLYDMSGNVWEWCWDWTQRPYTTNTLENPTGPSSGMYRTYKGGNWKSSARAMRVSGRFGLDPTNRSRYGFGFRMCRTEEYL